MSIGDAPSRHPEIWCLMCQETHDHEACEIYECEECGETHAPHCEPPEMNSCCPSPISEGHTRQCNDEARGDYLYDRMREDGF